MHFNTYIIFQVTLISRKCYSIIKLKGIMLLYFPLYLWLALFRCGWEEYRQFSVPHIDYPLGSSSKKVSHVYFLLIVTTIVTSDCTIVTLGHHGRITTIFISNNSITQKTCNRKYTWLPFMLLPPRWFGILFKVLRIPCMNCYVKPKYITWDLKLKSILNYQLKTNFQIIIIYRDTN